MKICKLLESICIFMAGHLACEGKRGQSVRPDLTWQSQNSWYAHSEGCLSSFHPQTLDVYLLQSTFIERVDFITVLFKFLMQCTNINIINDTTASPAYTCINFLTEVAKILWLFLVNHSVFQSFTSNIDCIFSFSLKWMVA